MKAIEKNKRSAFDTDEDVSNEDVSDEDEYEKP